MARKIAKINGKWVYSDKSLVSIVNSRVSFSDGSWCDVSTGEVENKGPGYISVGAPPSGEGEGKETEKEVLDGKRLVVKDVVADVDIQPYDGVSVEVTREGRKSDIDDIKIFESDGVVTVEGGGNNGGGGIRVGNISITSCGSISTICSGSNVVITSGGKSENDTKVKIKVPKGFSVSVANVCGLVTVGDTEGPFRVSSNTSGRVRAGCVGETDINIMGSTDVRIDRVRAELGISIQGSGGVKVKHGAVDSLIVGIQGSGDVSYGGKAINATLTVMGSGDIDVEHVENKPVISSLGSGEIEIGNW